jgi:predicted SAM-dependent methyltransferase
MPRPPSALLNRFPDIQRRAQTAEQILFRPVFLYLRDRGFKDYMKSRKGQPTGLHMGCAHSPIPGWFNCDLSTWSRTVNFVDATRRLPFPDASFDFVFSEHFIEHLGLEEGRAFFRESKRILKPGGILRTATPNLRFAADLCTARTAAHERYIEWLCSTQIPGQPRSHATVINHLFRGWGHRFIYDAEFLSSLLGELGFRNMKPFAPEASDTAFLRGLEQHGKSVPKEFNELETFVLEATR